jgi:hypothetical protein
VKTVDQVRTEIVRRLERTWQDDLTGTDHWPYTVPLSPPRKADLERQFPRIQQTAIALRAWATSHDLEVQTTNRIVSGTHQDIPTHVTIPALNAAASLAGQGWPNRLSMARTRLTRLQAEFTDASQWSKILRAVDRYDDVDFDLLCTVTRWFTTHDAAGLTPRQVPIPGVHAKWLNSHQPEILLLLDRGSLNLAPRHPSRIHFTYLDPAYRSSGARIHDSATVGDTMMPAYPPRIVLISENKDTAINFPPIPDAIAIEGEGTGGTTFAQFTWITEAPVLLYWGDIDADGFFILNGFRAAGVPATSILMDRETLSTYARFGTDLNKKNKPIPLSPRRGVLPYLTEEEQATLELLMSEEWEGPRRLEQERIPLSVAAAITERYRHPPD